MRDKYQDPLHQSIRETFAIPENTKLQPSELFSYIQDSLDKDAIIHQDINEWDLLNFSKNY